MSHSTCSNCGNPRFDDRGFHHHSLPHDHHHFAQHNHQFDREGCFCESFVCDDRFKVRLGGLTGGMNFRLRQLIGCEVKMKVDCGEECRDIQAEICFVGRDFVEVNVHKELDDHMDDIDDDMEEEELEKDCPHCKKHKRKKCKKCAKHKRRKQDFVIFPLESIKWFEIEDDCDCHDECDCC
ncbi:hypothetical protein [Gracilibacillus xinjiangensis]|uniref:Uncharacterized protein n=1 Tax=Gracilibacillus xinjiangensis TaxID=1193282 RepID=A0ABV8WU50_9BACI